MTGTAPTAGDEGGYEAEVCRFVERGLPACATDPALGQCGACATSRRPADEDGLRAAIEALARYSITGTEEHHGVRTTRTRDYVLVDDLLAALADHENGDRT